MTNVQATYTQVRITTQGQTHTKTHTWKGEIIKQRQQNVTDTNLIFVLFFKVFYMLKSILKQKLKAGDKSKKTQMPI